MTPVSSLGFKPGRSRYLTPTNSRPGSSPPSSPEGAGRDLFDARQLLVSGAFDQAMLRLAFVVYGGINRVNWRTVSTDTVTTTVDDVKRQLLPMLRQDIRPAASDVERWTEDLLEETRMLLGAVLLACDVLEFSDLLFELAFPLLGVTLEGGLSIFEKLLLPAVELARLDIMLIA
jgi:hypothetical protein